MIKRFDIMDAVGPQPVARKGQVLVTEKMVDRFLAWPLPKSVCSDLCVTDRNYKFPRSGTNLLTADEARQMIQYLLDPTAY